MDGLSWWVTGNRLCHSYVVFLCCETGQLVQLQKTIKMYWLGLFKITFLMIVRMVLKIAWVDSAPRQMHQSECPGRGP